jgi:predicted small metal-binding protein
MISLVSYPEPNRALIMCCAYGTKMNNLAIIGKQLKEHIKELHQLTTAEWSAIRHFLNSDSTPHETAFEFSIAPTLALLIKSQLDELDANQLGWEVRPRGSKGQQYNYIIPNGAFLAFISFELERGRSTKEIVDDYQFTPAYVSSVLSTMAHKPTIKVYN